MQKSSMGKGQSPLSNRCFNNNDFDYNTMPDPPCCDDFAHGNHEVGVDVEYSESDGSDDEDDPWKPLDPHKPGNLKIKPFRKGC